MPTANSTFTNIYTQVSKEAANELYSRRKHVVVSLKGLDPNVVGNASSMEVGLEFNSYLEDLLSSTFKSFNADDVVFYEYSRENKQ